MADPQTITQTQTTIPDYARPYVEGLLGQTAGTIYKYATDAQGNVIKDSTGMPVVSGLNPYQQYEGERTAQFTPLQMQAFQGAQNLGPDPYSQFAASGVANVAGAAANYGYNPTNYGSTYQGGVRPVRTQSFLSPGTAQAFMSPYMQNVVDVQQQQAKRQAGIAGQTQQAQAAQAGAFGGARDIIQRSQANAELQRNLANIQAQGLQSAYTQGQQQFNTQQQAALQAQMSNQQAGLTNAAQAAQYGQAANQLTEQSRQYGAGLGLQGLQAALSGYNTLGSLGNQLYNQQTGALNLQQQYGTQQQQQVQNILNTQYQDYLNQQNYPYKQLGYMSDMLRGLPLTQQSSSIYQAPPSTLSQVAGLGTAALAASKLVKKGGRIKDDAPKGLAALALSKI